MVAHLLALLMQALEAVTHPMAVAVMKTMMRVAVAHYLALVLAQKNFAAAVVAVHQYPERCFVAAAWMPRSDRVH